MLWEGLALRERGTGSDRVTYTFTNGLVVYAEAPETDDRLRILPLTRLQGVVLHYLTTHAECARGKRVFEPFAGSGALGFMALRLGATRVDFVDVNPRAAQFQQQTSHSNGFPADAVRSVTGDLRDFEAEEPYGLILANPPFLPTPECVEGTLNSNGGPDGGRLAGLVLERLDEFLQPDGEALMLLYQVAAGGVPLLAQLVADTATGRRAEFTPLQRSLFPFDEYCAAYERRYPAVRAGIRRWRADYVHAHGEDLTVSYYVLRLGPRDGTSEVVVTSRDASDVFGPDYLLPDEDDDYVPVDGRRR